MIRARTVVYRVRRRGESGYVLMVALILLAIISVIGSTTLNLAGVDRRIAIHNRLHMVVLNTAQAGTVHARNVLESEDPPAENLDSAGDTWGSFVLPTEGETTFGGIAFSGTGQNLGVYWVEAIYHKCANPPPGYSTEIGRVGFRSDFWNMESTSRMQDTSYANINESQAKAVSTVRKVVWGACRAR